MANGILMILGIIKVMIIMSQGGKDENVTS